MLAARYTETGPAEDVIRVEEVDPPEPRPGEVRVRVTVSGVNPTDWKARATPGTELPFGFQVPNQDGAGVIDAVGEGVDPSRVGQRVWLYLSAWGSPWGTATQWTVVPAEQAAPLPDGASDDLGASLGVPALTAHRCLLADGPIDGRTVLVAGGAGAVGHAAIELGRWTGARVIATVSSEQKAQLAREAGADGVVNYREPDAAEQVRALAPDGVDRVVELDLAANLDLDVAVCAPYAAIVTYADHGETPILKVRPLMISNLVLRFVLLYRIPPAALEQAVADVSRALSEGALTTLPLHRFELARTAAAHDATERGAVGKVLIDVP
jgi:NADPH:quinone reductase